MGFNLKMVTRVTGGKEQHVSFRLAVRFDILLEEEQHN